MNGWELRIVSAGGSERVADAAILEGERDEPIRVPGWDWAYDERLELVQVEPRLGASVPDLVEGVRVVIPMWPRGSSTLTRGAIADAMAIAAAMFPKRTERGPVSQGRWPPPDVVRDALERLLAADPDPTIVDVAAEIRPDLDYRQVQKSLDSHGTTFSEVRDTLRREIELDRIADDAGPTADAVVHALSAVCSGGDLLAAANRFFVRRALTLATVEPDERVRFLPGRERHATE